MDLYINSQKVEFTLNGEQTAADVRRSLLAILQTHGQALVSLSVDGDTGPAGLERPVAEIKAMRAEAENTGELVTSIMRGAADYLDRLDKVMADIGACDPVQQAVEIGLVRKDLADVLVWLAQAMESCAQIGKLAVPDLAPVSAAARAAAAALERASDDAAALAAARELLLPLLPRLRRLHATIALAGNAGQLRRRQLREQCARFAGELPALGAAFKQTAVHLQTGEEIKGLQTFQEAVSALQEFIAMLQEFQRLGHADFAAFIAEDQPLAHWVQDFLATLKSIVDTFGKRDYVLLADLLEYEMAPRLERWQRILRLIEPNLPAVD